MEFDPPFPAKCIKALGAELRLVIDYNFFWHAEFAYDVLQDESESDDIAIADIG